MDPFETSRTLQKPALTGHMAVAQEQGKIGSEFE